MNKIMYPIPLAILVLAPFLLTACGNTNKKKETVATAQQARRADFAKAGKLNVELGIGYLQQGQVARAKRKLMYANEISPELPEVHSALGYFFETVGNSAEAEKEYRQAIRLGREEGAYHNNYGTFLCREKRYSEAEQAFKLALADRTYERTAEVYENAGMCAFEAAEMTKSKQYLELAVRNDPKRERAMLGLAQIHFNQETYSQAQHYLRQLRRIAEPSAKSLWLGIQVAQKLQDPNTEASLVLLLKNHFQESAEYNLYLMNKQSG